MNRVLRGLLVASALTATGLGAQDRDQGTSTAWAELEPCEFLAVFAHPDDETFATGTLAKLAARDVCVQLVYATSGDAGGDLTDRGLSGAALGAEREQEMRRAARALNLPRAPVFLRHGDGKGQENWQTVLEDVEALLAKIQPRVVLTFGPDGYYGHSDHPGARGGGS